MRKLVTSAFVSLDGVMQAPGGPDEDPSGGFDLGGWFAGVWDDDLGAAMEALFAEPYDLVLGRKTYDIFAAYWPHVQLDPAASDFDALNVEIAKQFNACTKYVATHRPESLTWENSQALGDDVVAKLRAMKKTDGPRLLTQGSSVLVHALLEHGLIDELTLVIAPVTLGHGKRLFDDATRPAAFRLTGSIASRNGVLVGRYERAGEVATGSFAATEPSDAERKRRAALEEEARATP